MEESIIEIRDLKRDYGQGRGIFGVSFDVRKGECFGFLGPNGAGKSTTIRHLMGFSKPDSGCTLINGVNSLKKRDKVMNSVSYLPGEIALPASLTGQEFINEMVKLKNVKDKTYLNWLIDTFQLDTKLLCKEMSLGMKRKLAIVVCFMSDPDIIIMDEPSSGLDPEMQEVFIKLVKATKKRGKTILMSSHIFGEIDSCCDRIAVIKDGNIVSIFNASDLKHNTNKTYKLYFSNLEELERFSYNKPQEIKIMDANKEVKMLLVATEDKDINTFVSYLKDFKLSDFKEIKETLEDYFMSFYKEDKTYGGIKNG